MLKYLFSLLALCVVCAGQQAAQAQTHHEQHLRCGTCQHITANRQATVLSSTSKLERGMASKRMARKKTAAKRPTIDLLFVYDRTGEQEALKMGSLEAHAQKATQLSNTVLHNSNIEADFRLVGTMLLGEEIANITKGLDRGIYKADIDARRRGTKADIVVICSEPFHDGLAGIAIPEAPDGELAVASVRASAAVGGFTVVHEIGHIFGCQHSRESADPGNHAYAVGASRAPYYTVMGFAEQDGLTEQVPLFSGPQSVWNNVVMGSERENCVRKIRERLDVVSNFDQAQGYILDQTHWNIDSNPQSKEFKLTTTTYYFIDVDVPWLTTTPTQGYNNTTITVTARANPDNNTRVGTITIGAREDGAFPPVTITVTQRGMGEDEPPVTPPTDTPQPTYKLDIEGWDIEEQARSTKVKLTTTGEYTLETSASWLTTDIKEGKGDVEFTLSASENKSTATRTATLTIRDKQHKDIAPIVVKVNQEGRPTALLTTGNAKPLAQLRGQVLHLQLPTAMRLSLHDAQGRLLLHKQFKAGQHSLSLPHRGLFLLRWQQPLGTHTQRLLIP